MIVLPIGESWPNNWFAKRCVMTMFWMFSDSFAGEPITKGKLKLSKNFWDATSTFSRKSRSPDFQFQFFREGDTHHIDDAGKIIGQRFASAWGLKPT